MRIVLAKSLLVVGAVLLAYAIKLSAEEVVMKDCNKATDIHTANGCASTAPHIISDKTQAVIWKSRAKLTAINAQLEQTPLGKQRTAEMEAFNKAVQQATAECGAGFHAEQNQKDDLICAADKPKESNATNK